MFPHSKMDGVVIIRPKGQLDISNAASFKNWVRDNFINLGEKYLVIDLSDVKSVDSFTLGVFVSLYKSLVMNGGRLVLAGANDSIRKVITITSLDKIIPLVEEAKDALELF